MTLAASSAEPSQPKAGYVPPDPIGIAPLFVWPPQPKAFLQYMFGFPGYLWPYFVVFVGIAVISWLYVSPDMVQAKTLSVDWIAMIVVRNGLLMTLFAGSFYYFLYVRKTQGTQYKYNPNWPAKDSPRFLFKNPVWESIFWCYCSALPFWSAYEVLGLWLHANGYAPSVNWTDNPVYCTALVLMTPIWAQLHFWAVHRLLHWPPLYRAAHYLHHKNVNTNCWSGLSMHPIEHLIFFSGAIFFYVVPSHPFHLVLYLQLVALSTCFDHSGFHKLILPGKREFIFDFYYHYLHHKYVEVNYAADSTIPLDKWLGEFHDGTAQALEAFKKRRFARPIRELEIRD
jgi:sterol desaturase/sphingolipid hydroxylase (fatty acid hydroxylase superfamily)